MDSAAPLSFLLLLSLAAGSTAQDRLTGKPWATRSEIYSQSGMAATSQPIATQVALDILRKGGSAVDAAIAANATLHLAEPTGCGLGGDLFAIVWDAKTEKLHGLNASGRSPASLSLEYFRENGLDSIPAHGPLPVSVPGCADGWFELHARFGKLSMADVLSPAINYAKQGIPITEVIAHYWSIGAANLQRFDGFQEVFMPGGRAPGKGEIFRNPALASSFEKLVVGGRDAFYKGDIATAIGSYIAQQGGFLSYEDLAAHESEWVDPVSTDYRGYEVWELPPNGQGIAALQILNILEDYDLSAMGFGSAEYMHLFIEAKKLAYEDRARWYADPAFAKLPVKELISKKYAAQRRQLIDLKKAADSYPPGNPALSHGDTIYLTTADSAGNMVSLIQSNFRGMGSGMTPPGLGFVLQDRGELFDLRAGRPNSYAPKKRPFHTIIPAFVSKDGKPWLSFGVMGGAMQPQGHVQILVNMIDFGMNLQEAGDAPRMRHSGSSQPTGSSMIDGGLVNLESGFSSTVLQQLRDMGHVLKIGPGGFGGYQAILRDLETGVYAGASESRKDGQAAGY